MLSDSLSCISYYSYIKPQPLSDEDNVIASCISYYSYIKPQLITHDGCYFLVVYHTIPTSNHNPAHHPSSSQTVVYHTIPTSNHNSLALGHSFGVLYIILFLHQTTTLSRMSLDRLRCISYYSYIKPQRIVASIGTMQGCISYYSYIKPQLLRDVMPSSSGCISYYSYIKPQLGQLSYHQSSRCISYYSYIKPQLLAGVLATS